MEKLTIIFQKLNKNRLFLRHCRRIFSKAVIHHSLGLVRVSFRKFRTLLLRKLLRNQLLFRIQCFQKNLAVLAKSRAFQLLHENLPVQKAKTAAHYYLRKLKCAAWGGWIRFIQEEKAARAAADVLAEQFHWMRRLRHGFRQLKFISDRQQSIRYNYYFAQQFDSCVLFAKTFFKWRAMAKKHLIHYRVLTHLAQNSGQSRIMRRAVVRWKEKTIVLTQRTAQRQTAVQAKMFILHQDSLILFLKRWKCAVRHSKSIKNKNIDSFHQLLQMRCCLSKHNPPKLFSEASFISFHFLRFLEKGSSSAKASRFGAKNPYNDTNESMS
jgi:hypothetical protein